MRRVISGGYQRQTRREAGTQSEQISLNDERSEMAELLKPRKEEMKMNMKRKLLGAVALFAMFSAFEANAQQNLNVSATVPDVCVITTPGTALNLPFDLSTLDIAVADFTATVDFLWRCSQGNAATINLSSGAGTGADANTRYMTGPGGVLLAYTLTTPGGVAWGDGTNGQLGFGVTGAGMAAANEQATAIDGTLALADAQAATTGAYADTVVITLLP
jgi:spore coat protein U-like protein